MENFPHLKNNTEENIPLSKVEVEPEYAEIVPQEFLDDPAGYFEREGKNIKTGEIKYDELGIIRDDPTAVKDLPIWKNVEGTEIQTVGKRVNTAKGGVGDSDDPFYEYKILEKLSQIGLPAAKPIAKAEQANNYIIVMERIPGLRWSEMIALFLQKKGNTHEDFTSLLSQAEEKMNELKARFDGAGVIRKWELKDMVFQIDIENKKLISVVPTDWERTTILKKP